MGVHKSAPAHVVFLVVYIQTMSFDQATCDRCGEKAPGYYTLSSKTKGLYIQCPKCGNHAAPFKQGLKLAWKPSKSFIKEVGLEEATRIAREAEKSGEASPVVVTATKADEPRTLDIMSNGPIFFCDAGTKNNGRFGHQRTVVVVTDATGKVLVEEWVGDKTNNEGELIAIARAAGKVPRGALILSDSDLAVKWVGGKYRTKIARLKPLIYDAMSATKAKDISLKWIPREKNLAGHYIEEKHSL